MNSKSKDLEQLTIRRASVADTDKVRYRVYSTPKDFIAVIAESALMAVKVSGISKPHKIVRDLPTDGVAIEAKKMATVSDKPERVPLAMKPPEKAKQIVADLAPKADADKAALFRPINIHDLQNRSRIHARILPPEMLSQIIEDHVKATIEPTPAPAVIAPPPVAVAIPEVAPEEVLIPPLPQPTLSPKEKLLQAADEVFAQNPPPAVVESQPAIAENVLSPEDVEKLLNG